MKTHDPAFDRPCSVCGAPSGEGCRDDDGLPRPMTSMHIGRVTGGKPLVVRHTGRFDADGGGIFDVVDAETEEEKP